MNEKKRESDVDVEIMAILSNAEKIQLYRDLREVLARTLTSLAAIIIWEAAKHVN